MLRFDYDGLGTLVVLGKSDKGRTIAKEEYLTTVSGYVVLKKIWTTQTTKQFLQLFSHNKKLPRLSVPMPQKSSMRRTSNEICQAKKRTQSQCVFQNPVPDLWTPIPTDNIDRFVLFALVPQGSSETSGGR